MVCVTLGDSAQHMIRRRDEKMAMIMPGNIRMLLAPHYFSTSTAEVAYHNSDRKQQQQKGLTTVVAETHGRRMVATAPVKRTIAVCVWSM